MKNDDKKVTTKTETAKKAPFKMEIVKVQSEAVVFQSKTY
jgi:hypothetical protein